VDLVIEHANRRIGIRLSVRYERETEEQDAIALVYGRFDALYRIRCSDPVSGAVDAAYLMVAAFPSWFTLSGRMQAGRLASEEAVLSGDRLETIGSITLDTLQMTRIRLSRANDWVRAFEAGLSRPWMRRHVK